MRDLLALNRCVGTAGWPTGRRPAGVRSISSVLSSFAAPALSHSALPAAGSQSSITVPPQFVLMSPIGTPSERCRSSP